MRASRSTVAVAALASALGAACGTHSTLDLSIGTPTPSTSPLAIVTGDGRDGNLTTGTAGTTTLGDCRTVSAASPADVTIDTTGLTPGTLLLLIQMQENFATSGDAAAIPATSGVGRWDLVQVASTSLGSVALVETSLHFAYSSGDTRRAQACIVPQYTNVTIRAGALVKPHPWDGSTGGVLAFVANGIVQVDGDLSADRAGFRGGVVSSNANYASVTELDTTAGRGAGKGEGPDGRGFALYGRGNYSIAGGGGNAHNAGGGGGGNAGAGGQGGKQATNDGDEPLTAGLAGSSAADSWKKRIVLGGGGGGGHQNLSKGTPGGAGGGILFLSVRSLSGVGDLRAQGETAGLAFSEGAGGGGAGGTVVVLAIESSWSGKLKAIGGDGGHVTNSTDAHGPGGGGGGGRIAYSANIVPQSITLTGGAPGVNDNLGNDPNAATAGSPGTAETN